MSYPPAGDRGVATYNRSARWGNDLSVLELSRDAACIIQIENIEALNDVDDIARLEGVDVLFVGPLDLSFALGIPRDFTHPVFVEACHKVLAAGKKKTKSAGSSPRMPPVPVATKTWASLLLPSEVIPPCSPK